MSQTPPCSSGEAAADVVHEEDVPLQGTNGSSDFRASPVPPSLPASSVHSEADEELDAWEGGEGEGEDEGGLRPGVSPSSPPPLPLEEIQFDAAEAPFVPRPLGGKTGKRRAASGGRRRAASGLDQPETSFAADLRCAVRVGASVWTAERDGCIVVRHAETSKLQQRLVLPGFDVFTCLAPVGGKVWCGSEKGAILIFDAKQRSLSSEVKQHSGPVHCICPSPSAGPGPYVISGGSDGKLRMWACDGKPRKLLSGHRGGVRCVLIAGLEIWSGSDDHSVRVWDAAYGLFNLETEPCRAVLTGHTASVHALLAHTDAVLSAAADGTVRAWRASGTSHECMREVVLGCGPVSSLVPMGRCVWAAGQDGVVHALDGATLEPAAAPRRAHTGFVTGMCKLGARTTRACWSYSSVEKKVCVWRTEEAEGQHVAEVAAAATLQSEALGAQLSEVSAHRASEQRAHAEYRATAEEEMAVAAGRIAALGASEAKLLSELAASIELQESDIAEAERLRGLLREREDEIGRLAAESEARRVDGERGWRAAREAEAAHAAAAARCAELEAELASSRREAAERQRVAERLAARRIAARVRRWPRPVGAAADEAEEAHGAGDGAHAETAGGAEGAHEVGGTDQEVRDEEEGGDEHEGEGDGDGDEAEREEGEAEALLHESPGATKAFDCGPLAGDEPEGCDVEPIAADD